MFANKIIWFPYNENVRSLAMDMIAQSKQEGLGITVWGFVSKF